MFQAPFQCFNHPSDKKFNDVFSMSMYWFLRWEDLIIYTTDSSDLSVNNFLKSIGIKKSLEQVKDMLDHKVKIDEIVDPETYILYKTCRQFIEGTNVVSWETIQQLNCIEKEYSVPEWIASDKDHLAWITLKIMNGFDDFNPFRLHTWGFWKNICFMAQNERALDVFRQYKN